MKKTVCKAIVVFLALMMIFCTFMTLSAAIPRAWIQKNMDASAMYYKDKPNLEEVIEGYKISAVHNHANATWLNIAWNFDEKHPFTSAMEARYYQGFQLELPPSFYETVTGQSALGESTETSGQPNRTYGRYWHGTAGLVRLLMVVLPAGLIPYFFGGLLLFTVLFSLYLSYKKRLFSILWCLLLVVVVTSVYLVPLSLDITSCVILAFAFMDYILWKGTPDKDFTPHFVAFGALVCFFDFLTAETLTLTLPLLALLAMGDRDNMKKTIKYCTAWLIAYGMTYLVKWCIVSLVTGETISAIALEQGAMRMSGSIGIAGVNQSTQGLLGLATALNFVFPMQLGNTVPEVWCIFGAVAAVLVTVWFFFRKQPLTGMLPVALVGLIPFVRMLVMSNHTAIHPFTVNRAFLATVIAISMLLGKSLAKPPEKRRKKT